jgi:TetR/AcrR family transcriptional regulator, tetracycline repressor protein
MAYTVRMADPFLPWDQYGKPARTRQPLSREAIVDAAMKIIDEQGLSALSMRAVAQALDTGPASLYAHVANKEQLIDLVLDRVYGEIEVPEIDPARWQEQLKDFTRSGLKVILSHRGLSAAMLGGPPMGPNGLRLMEASVGLAHAAGLSEAHAAFMGELVGQYIAVNALEQETFRERFGAASEDEVSEWVDQFRGYLQSLPPERFPTLVALARSGALMSPNTEEERFEMGLDILVRGLASYIESRN